MIPTPQPKTTAHSLSYRDKLSPWCIIRLFPNMQQRSVARFRRRNDAESHLQVLRRLMPSVPFEIVFDVAPDKLQKTLQ